MQNNIKTETQYARCNFYHSDGTGRDTYIKHDNGGLTLNMEQVRLNTSNAFRPKRAPQVYRPQSSNKTLHYLSDGSGRDNYVLDNHGGLMNTQSDVHWLNSFKRDLRSPFRPRPRSGAVTPNPKYQQSISKRLSRPKHTTIPFSLQVSQFKQQNMYKL